MLGWLFLFSLLMMLTLPIFLPQLHLLAFSPFLAFVCHHKPYFSSLCIAAGCGLLVDLFSSESRLGIYALSLCATTALLYPQKHHFFQDKPMALALFTALISATTTLVLMGVIAMFSRQVAISWLWLLVDLIIMPLADALYAYFIFYFLATVAKNRVNPE